MRGEAAGDARGRRGRPACAVPVTRVCVANLVYNFLLLLAVSASFQCLVCFVYSTIVSYTD